MAPGGDDLIILTDCVRYLGVMVDDKPSFISHEDYVYHKEKKTINLLLRAFNLE